MEVKIRKKQRHKRNSPETIFESALNYQTRYDFFRNDMGGYKMAKRLGIFEQVCAHMGEAYSFRKRVTRQEMVQTLKAIKDTCPCDPDINEEWQGAWNQLLTVLNKVGV